MLRVLVLVPLLHLLLLLLLRRLADDVVGVDINRQARFRVLCLSLFFFFFFFVVLQMTLLVWKSIRKHVVRLKIFSCTCLCT